MTVSMNTNLTSKPAFQAEGTDSRHPVRNTIIGAAAGAAIGAGVNKFALKEKGALQEIDSLKTLGEDAFEKGSEAALNAVKALSEEKGEKAPKGAQMRNLKKAEELLTKMAEITKEKAAEGADKIAEAVKPHKEKVMALLKNGSKPTALAIGGGVAAGAVIAIAHHLLSGKPEEVAAASLEPKADAPVVGQAS